MVDIVPTMIEAGPHPRVVLSRPEDLSEAEGVLTLVKDRAGPTDRIGWIGFSLLAVLGLCLVFAACGKSPDRRAYDDVVATMSLHKAEQFFERFPQSPCRDRLVDDIIGWCRREGTAECYEMALGVIPKDHPGYEAAVSDYSRRFGERAR